MRTYIIFSIIILYSLNLFSQTTIEGKITDETGEPLSGVNIALYHPDDTIRIITGTATGEDGVWQIEDISKGKYRIVLSYLGFMPVDTLYTIKEKKNKLEMSLHASSELLENLIITGNLLTVFGNKEVRLFSKDEHEKAASGLELMENLPQLNIDNLNTKLLTIDGQSVLILIDGIPRAEADLAGMPSNQIAKTEYYSYPPTRFRNLGVGAVLVVTTKRTRDTGGYLMTNLSNSFTTGFGTDILQGKLSNGNNDYTLRYFLDYRDLNKNRINQQYCADLENGEYDIRKEGLNSDYKGLFHRITGSWSNIIPEKQLWSITASLGINPLKEATFQNITDNISESQGKSVTKAETNYLSPALDIYYARQLKNKQEIIFNIVNTYYNNTADRELTLSSNGINDYQAITNIDSKTYSIISEGAYTKEWEDNHEFSAGAKYYYKNIHEKYSSNLSLPFSAHHYIHNLYAYAEWNRKYKNLFYTLGMGAEQTRISTEKDKNYFVLKPTIMLSYSIKKHSTLKLTSTIESYVPDMSLLSSSTAYLDSLLISRGNPNLKPYYEYANYLTYTLSIPGFYMQTGPSYKYAHHPYTTQFSNRREYLEKSTTHISNTQKLNYGLFFNWRPANWIRLAPFYQIEYQTSKGDGFHYHHWYSRLNLSGTLYYKKVSLNGICIISNKTLEGTLLRQPQKYYEITAGWKHKNLSISLSTLFLHNPEKFETYEKTSFYYGESKTWNNFKGLMYAKLIYTLPFGKSIQRQDKQRMQNSDNDSGVSNDNKAKL